MNVGIIIEEGQRKDPIGRKQNVLGHSNKNVSSNVGKKHLLFRGVFFKYNNSKNSHGHYA